MILTAHQPTYLPWLGLFEKIARAEKFCIFDAVQAERRGWTTRNFIKTANGPLLLSVPVSSKDHLYRRICDVELMVGNWTRKHMRSIELAYRKAPYFEQHFAGVGAILDLYADGGLLADLNTDLLRYFLRALGIQIPLVKASDFEFQGDKSALVLDMCKVLGATSYIFGGEGENYADAESFARAGVECQFQHYEHPVYPQLHGAFEPRMSVLDLLMNCGPSSLGILTGVEERLAA